MPTHSGAVPNAIYPDTVDQMQTLPDKFTPPAFWGKYPSFGAPQTTQINSKIPWFSIPAELGPSYGAGGGQMVSTVNVYSPLPVPPQSINSGV
jgi:hypothetical protein